MFKLTYF